MTVRPLHDRGTSEEEGFNAQTERYENLVQAGVIDPTKVVRSALQQRSVTSWS